MPWILCGVWDALFNHHRQRVCSIRGTNCAKMPFMFNVHVWTKERLRQSQRFTYAMDFAPNSNCSNSRQWILCFSTGSISPAELLFGFFFIDWSDWGVQMRVKILHPVKRNVWRRPQCRSHIPVILSIVRCNNSCSFYALRRLSAFSHVANLSLLQCFSMRLIHNSATLSFSFPIFFSFSLLLLFLSRQSLFIFSWKAETNEKINTCQMRRSSKNTHLDTQSTNEQQNKMTYKIRSNKTNKNKMKMKARMKMSGVSQHSSLFARQRTANKDKRRKSNNKKWFWRKGNRQATTEYDIFMFFYAFGGKIERMNFGCGRMRRGWGIWECDGTFQDDIVIFFLSISFIHFIYERNASVCCVISHNFRRFFFVSAVRMSNLMFANNFIV